ncbi:MAG: sodium:proton antiporter [Acidimicrobiia bacterium]|nr:sodium:proton antiporter [Acidimicrobiia bacterium]
MVAYAAVAAEEQLHLRKSIPVLVAAGLVWLLVGVGIAQTGGDAHGASEAAKHNLLDFAELFLFLVVSMTYVNTLDERGLFGAVRGWLVARRLSLRALFWVTGGIAFVLSPVADNLTTALILGAVVMAIGQGHPRFVSLACINVVVAANAGGAFSPFGDITTLMVWQKGVVPFAGFLPLIVPSLVNWLVPAVLMGLAVERDQPAMAHSTEAMERGAVTVALLFLVTIGLTVMGHSLLDLPPAVGMMFGLGLLKLYGYVLNRGASDADPSINELDDVFASHALGEEARPSPGPAFPQSGARARPLHTFRQLERVEWDTLMFFYGVVMCIGGLGALGYLRVVSHALYDGLGPTATNIVLGLVSAVIDNVPVMFAVLSMNPAMSQGEWLLVTLTTGVGGSILSFGSAAGVALMGQARGTYTFMSHLRWSWAIGLGYVASIAVHLLLNGGLF